MVRKMLASNSFEEGWASTFTSSWASRSRFSLLSIRKSLTISSIDLISRFDLMRASRDAPARLLPVRPHRHLCGRLKSVAQRCSWTTDASSFHGRPTVDLEACPRHPYTGGMHVHSHGGGNPSRVLKVSLAVTLAYIALLVVA